MPHAPRESRPAATAFLSLAFASLALLAVGLMLCIARSMRVPAESGPAGRASA